MDGNEIAPRYWKLQEGIKALILDRGLGKGDKIPSERELCKIFNLSLGTVQKSVDKLVQEGVLEKRHGSGTYVQDCSKARPLRPARKALGLILPDIDYFYSPVIRGIEEACSSAGYSMILRKGSRLDNSVELSVIKSLIERDSVAGVMIAPTDFKPDAGNYWFLRSSGVPFVIIDRKVESFEADYVAQDNPAGTRLATETLLASGVKRIAFAALSHVCHYHYVERLKGYRQALEKAGIPFDESLVFNVHDDEDFNEGMLGRFMEGMKKPSRPDGVVCYTDDTAVNILNCVLRAGFSTPEDLAIIGYDDTDFARSAKVPLTSVSPQKEEMGRLAVRRLLEIVSGVSKEIKQYELEPGISIRESSMSMVAK